MKIPQASNLVSESQRLGVTDITIKYSSPSVNGRDVWNSSVIPKNGDPIAWRAGANMNTTIEFSTDVAINGQPLKAGKYGFHVIPGDNTHTLIFAHANNLWGSYYLNMEEDISLRVEVASRPCQFSEKLDYEFLNWEEDAVEIALEWADKQIPFKVSVDLNTTVINSFRAELRGENTNRWQAWNDAASWCINRNINLEEALEWANRSINGGYGGFAANKNLTNVSTKFYALSKLNIKEQLSAMIEEIAALDYSDGDAFYLSKSLIDSKNYALALDLLKLAHQKYPDQWYLYTNDAVSNYFLGNHEKAVELMKKTLDLSPPQQHIARINEVISEMESGTYQIPVRS
ncbi:DUF2911 domain-containing protein [uncultured Psychroserpens sp.]|uniref:DUF2911 domain-containing protein n=1 Tax=uncultured Psychroserpens sp. TaxID=255436 RepID=UPI00261977A1|nr:DUF2911 domain-containing protein [uncultured Psychroserpens sp.]